jgi:2-keto-4-pentenoate hydratase
MLTLDIHNLAARQLADFDARTPNRMFAESVDMTTAQAYELQDEVARLRERRGEKIVGYKVGCTSAAIQQQLGISEPIFGRLFETGCHPSGVRLSCGDFANAAVEGEFAVLLARHLAGAPLSNEQCLEAIETIFPVIELHHYVLCGARPTCQELIASDGMHAGFVLADRWSTGSGWSTGFSLPAAGEPTEHHIPDELPGLTIVVRSASNGVIVKSSTLSRPVELLRWLAGRLAERGLSLSAGQIVLTSSPMELFPVAPGSHVLVKAESLGETRAEFVE